MNYDEQTALAWSMAGMAILIFAALAAALLKGIRRK